MIKVSELKDEHLDFWAAKAEGKEVLIAGGMAQTLYRRDSNGDESYQQYSPSTDWSQGGPIAERERIHVQPIRNMRGEFLLWSAKLPKQRLFYDHASYLIAAMRCFVASKFGEYVDDSQAHNV